MSLYLFILLLAAPGVWAALLMMPTSSANHHSAWCGRLANVGVWLAMGGAAAAVAATITAGGSAISLPSEERVMFYLDALSVTMAALIGFIGWVILRYSRTYLKGEENQGRFFQWLGGTLGSVFLLVISGNLALLLAAWISTSLCLHKLLLFYPHREASIISARKKFVFSRLGDACLLIAAALIFQKFGTLELPGILNQSRSLAGMELDGALTLAIACIAFGAVLKSAQFPFHTWLPDTLETPTPVSALMHAGIISAGGFLLIRLSPLVALSGEIMLALALIGALTAVFGSLVMLTQTSIKKSLAFSTVAQMGFMMMQCGLGAFALAALHLVAHSLYKAHAFLESGEAISRKPPRPLSSLPQNPLSGGFVLVLFLGILLCVGIGLGFGISLQKEPGLLVLGSILIMAITTLLWTCWGHRRGVFLMSLPLALGVCTAYFALHHASIWILQDSIPTQANPAGPWAWAVYALILTAFLGVFLLQVSLPLLQRSRWGQRLYVLVFNRFYVNAMVNRLLLKLWPVA